MAESRNALLSFPIAADDLSGCGSGFNAFLEHLRALFDRTSMMVAQRNDSRGNGSLKRHTTRSHEPRGVDRRREKRVVGTRRDDRSEERRVGKECSCRWLGNDHNKHLDLLGEAPDEFDSATDEVKIASIQSTGTSNLD